MGDVFDSGGDGIVSCEWRVHDDAKAFHLQVGLVQGFKGAPIVEVVVKWDCKVGICDSSDQCRVFSRRQE